MHVQVHAVSPSTICMYIHVLSPSTCMFLNVHVFSPGHACTGSFSKYMHVHVHVVSLKPQAEQRDKKPAQLEARLGGTHTMAVHTLPAIIPINRGWPHLFV